MKNQNEDILRGGRDTFFQYFKLFWWPNKDNTKLPSDERQLELFKRICVKVGKEIWIKSSLEEFNSLLNECNQPSVEYTFYEHFFPEFNNTIRLGAFIEGVQKFVRVALWKWGNFNKAFEILSKSKNIKNDLQGIPFDNIDPIAESKYTERRPFNITTDLNPEECFILGYATTETPNGIINNERIKEIGKKNVQEYLSIDDLDVYIATSMREMNEFKSFKQLINEIFEHPDINKLNIRYFDPTIGYCDNRISKGLLEALMLKRAKITLYVAGLKDTFGKDSECASTLVQGKPVVVYIEETQDGRKEELDKRAEIFKEKHPLGLQVCQDTGVANGVIVVRNPEDCRNIIRQLLLHQLDVYYDKETNAGFILKEESTQSVLRVAVNDPLLARSFQNYYFTE